MHTSQLERYPYRYRTATMKYIVLILLAVCLFHFTSASEVTSQNAEQGRIQRSGNHTSTYKFIADKCVFILSTGHSGSTGLMDALNQLPHYLIRGEQYAAFYNIYESYMNFRWTTTEPLSQKKLNWAAYRYAPLETIKQVYNQQAPREKLNWFNEFPQERIIAAARSYYAVLYGYYGKNFVSGFKDSRYVCGKSFEGGRCAEFFTGFMEFLRKLCSNVKVLLNSRTSSSLAANSKLYGIDWGRSEEDFLRDLNQTHALYDNYVAQSPHHAFRVYYEDMHDPTKNASLARRLLEFLSEDPATPIRFNRMPLSKPPGT